MFPGIVQEMEIFSECFSCILLRFRIQVDVANIV